MRIAAYIAVAFSSLLCGCASQSHSRADYVRATLPYESAMLVKSAEQIRRGCPDISSDRLGLLGLFKIEQLILDDALRLHICLSDPRISEQDKSYGRDVLPLVVSYISTNNIGREYKSGKEYEMLPDDFIFPPKMKIRDVLDELIQERK